MLTFHLSKFCFYLSRKIPQQPMRLFLSALLLCISFSVINAQEKATIILKSGFSNLCYIHSIDSNYVHYTALGLQSNPQDSVKLSEVLSISYLEHFGKPLKQPNDSIRVAGNIYSMDPAEPLTASEKSIRKKQLQTIYDVNYEKGHKMFLAGVILLPSSIAFTGVTIVMLYSDNLGAQFSSIPLMALIAVPAFISGNVILPIGLDRMARAKAAKATMQQGPPTLSFHPSQINGGFGNMALGAGITLNF